MRSSSMRCSQQTNSSPLPSAMIVVVAALLVLNGDSGELLNAVDAEGRRPHDLLSGDAAEALTHVLAEDHGVDVVGRQDLRGECEVCRKLVLDFSAVPTTTHVAPYHIAIGF